jgi:hypothetical protein
MGIRHKFGQAVDWVEHKGEVVGSKLKDTWDHSKVREVREGVVDQGKSLWSRVAGHHHEEEVQACGTSSDHTCCKVKLAAKVSYEVWRAYRGLKQDQHASWDELDDNRKNRFLNLAKSFSDHPTATLEEVHQFFSDYFKQGGWTHGDHSEENKTTPLVGELASMPTEVVEGLTLMVAAAKAVLFRSEK